MPSEPKKFGFPKAEHLRRPEDFRRVFDARCSVSDQLLVVYVLGNDLPHARLGLSVSKKRGSAVVRNRLRRLYREAYRLNKHDLPAGLDIIVLPRPGEIPSLAEVAASLVKLVQAAGKKLARRERKST